jgi:hypothetical protein
MRRSVVVVGAAAAAALSLRGRGRMRGSHVERVDLYYDDGSLVTLVDAEAEPLLELARAALRVSALGASAA